MMNAAIRGVGVEAFQHYGESEVSSKQERRSRRREKLFRISYRFLMSSLAVAAVVVLQITLSF